MKEKKHLGGRPTKYKTEISPEQAGKLAEGGMIDTQIAETMGIGVTTLNVWKQKYPEFRLSIKKGKNIVDAEVVNSLFQRAVGYEHPEEKIFQYKGNIIKVNTIKHYPPDTTACIFWLKNRQPELWRDKQEIHNTSDVILHIDKDDAGL